MLRAMKRLAAVIAVASLALVAACEQGKDKDTPATEGTTTGEVGDSAGLEDRVARLERKIKKVEGFLNEATQGQYGRVVPDPAATYAVPVAPLDPVQGPDDAAVTLIEAFTYT